MDAHAPKGIEVCQQEQNGSGGSTFFPHTAVAEHEVAVIVRQQEDQEQYQTEEVHLPVEPSSLAGEERDDLEEDELEEVAREGEDDAEDDLDEDPQIGRAHV